jgi:diaminopimelate epimerase
MTTLRLTKHHGLGNDFLVVFDLEHPDSSALARRLCDRRRGVGADGLLIGSSADGHDARMVLYNADGSRAEMSGNGIRCFAQALAMRDEAASTVRILTDAGSREVTFVGEPTVCGSALGTTVDARVEMGEVGEAPEPDGWAALRCHPDRPVAHLDLGNPHSVVGVDEVAVVDLAELGSKVPQINLEIIEPGPAPDAITMRVHERGAGITEACGTGASAAAYAARSWGLVAASAREVVVHMDGGTARVGFAPDAPRRAVLTGPTTYVATIEVDGLTR